MSGGTTSAVLSRWRAMRTPRGLSLCGWLLYLMVRLAAAGEDLLASDAAALAAFLGGLDRRPPRLTWPAHDPSSVCSWQGVTCSPAPAPRVVSLRLPGVGLAGPIRGSTLGRLSALRVLSLRNNELSGAIPADLSDCTQLRALYLQDNALTGALPPLPALIVRVNLAYNRFSSLVPHSYVLLPRLGTLFLQNNSLSGPFPSTAPFSLPNLAQFSVAYNNLNGSIPSSLQQKFGFPAFSGNDFCGPPLFRTCPNAPVPSMSPSLPPTPFFSTQGTPSSPHNPRHFPTIYIVAIVIGSLVFLMLLSMFVVYYVKRRNALQAAEALPTKEEISSPRVIRPLEVSKEEPSQQAFVTHPTSMNNKLVFLDGSQYMFDLDELLRASAEVLGKGSMGTSYKVVLEDGSILVVKRIKDVSLGQKEFAQHVELLGSLKHNHLVPLRAYYYSKEEKLLLLDYLPMGSLSALLHGNKGAGRNTLNWTTRLKIAIGAAKGIAFLHEQNVKYNKELIHGNIKSSNILISKDYEASISDFGLAPLFGSIPTTSRMGGYIAPEVLETRKSSQKSDIYSFGVLLLELLTGKDPLQASREEGIDLPRWVQSLVLEEWSTKLFDMELVHYNQNVKQEEMMQVVQIAISCVSKVPNQRPTMLEVVKMLEDVSDKESM